MATEELSILNITGKLDNDTPIFIILEIADSMGISYDKGSNFLDVVSKINSTHPMSISKPYKEADYVKMASFVNPYVDWDIGNLETSFKFLLNFKEGSRESILVTSDSKFGPQTPDNPNNISNIIIYTLCKFYELKFSKHTTEEDLLTILLDFLQSKERIKESILKKIEDLPPSTTDLLKIYKYIYSLKK